MHHFTKVLTFQQGKATEGILILTFYNNNTTVFSSQTIFLVAL